MSGNAYTDGLNYDLIKKAVHGEKDALEEILRIYEPFHNALVTREVIGPDGKIHKEIDEDKKIQVQMHLHGIRFDYQSAMLFITLPSGRRLVYVKPRIGENQFGGDSVTHMGIGGTKKWERLESYGPKFVENIVQATARDILCHAMQTLRNCAIVAHVHDEIIIEADRRMSVEAVCEQMDRTPPWAKGLKLRADGYECLFYQKD